MAPKLPLKTLFIRALFGYMLWHRVAFFAFSSLGIVFSNFIWINDLGTRVVTLLNIGLIMLSIYSEGRSDNALSSLDE